MFLKDGIKEKLAAKAQQEDQEKNEKVKEKVIKEAGTTSKDASGTVPRKICKQQSVDSGNEASSEDSNDSNKYNKGIFDNSHLVLLVLNSFVLQQILQIIQEVLFKSTE